MRNHIITPCNSISSNECAVPCKCMPRIVRGGLYIYSNRHHLKARDRYSRRGKDGQSARARVCMRQKQSLICGWFVSVDLRTQYLTCVHMSVSPGVRHMRFAEYWTYIRGDHWSDTSLIFVCKPILHYIICATYINTVHVCCHHYIVDFSHQTTILCS